MASLLAIVFVVELAVVVVNSIGAATINNLVRKNHPRPDDEVDGDELTHPHLHSCGSSTFRPRWELRRKSANSASYSSPT